MSPAAIKPGDAARIRHSIHSPYAGRTGVVMNIDTTEARGHYLVMFSDGLQFRYTAQELESPDGPRQYNVFVALHRVLRETAQRRKSNVYR